MDFETLLFIAPFKWSAIGTAVLCGAIIGLERQLKGKPVGIRTSALTILGTYLFITASTVVTEGVSDPSRVIGQVVTGVGFLGAGVMMAKEGAVVGVTSAATIWSLAAIGVCLSVVNEIVALKISVVIFVILRGVDLLETYSSIFTRGAYARKNARHKKKPTSSR